ncbi:hypothetical protein PENSPDRAFT_410602 [Peniophora sp. CONT]|nr:hypothetical protein PENSPDRAFT_410602 [Peniophora sp. CONT]
MRIQITYHLPLLCLLLLSFLLGFCFLLLLLFLGVRQRSRGRRGRRGGRRFGLLGLGRLLGVLVDGGRSPMSYFLESVLELIHCVELAG